MKRSISWRHPLPWLAGGTGLLAGFLCQPMFRGEPPTSGTATLESGDPDSRGKSTKPAAAPVPIGPATRLLREISNATAAECEQRVKSFYEAREAGREIDLEVIFRRWLKLESADAILAKLDGFGGMWPTSWNTAFFLAWVEEDESAAMDRAKHPRLAAARALFAIQSGNPSFADYFAGTENFFTFEEQAAEALTLLARDRPDVAMLVATAEIPQALKAKAITAVARGWASLDPAAALAWVRSLGQADGALGAVFSEWAKTDPAGAGEAKTAAGIVDVTMGHELVTNLALRSLNEPRNAVNQLSIALLRDPFLDVAAFHQHLLDSGIDWERKYFGMPAINHDGWYPADPEAAAREAGSLPPGKERDFILTSICHNWAAHDLDAAAAFAKDHGIQSSYLEELQLEPTEAMREAARTAPDETFAALFDPESDSTGRQALYTLATEWAAADPETVSEWLIGRVPADDGEVRDTQHADLLFSNTLGYQWARQDPIGASQWVGSLPDGPLKSRAWGAMSERVADYSPDLAFELSTTLLDRGSRMPLLESQLKAVGQKIGYPAAFELLKSPDLSEQESAVLAESLRSSMGAPAR